MDECNIPIWLISLYWVIILTWVVGVIFAMVQITRAYRLINIVKAYNSLKRGR